MSWDGARTRNRDHPFTHLQLPFELPQPSSPPRRRRSPSRKWQHILSYYARRPPYYLVLYFALNLALTLYNKSLLLSFPFPYTLSAMHALCTSIGSFVLLRTRSSPLPRLNQRQKLVLLAFSCLYTINIVASNVSLGLVTVPFHQVVRASTPFFTIVFSAIILGTRSSHARLIALLPVVAGVGFATYGDYYFTPWGLCLTLLGTVLAALKTIYTNVLQKPSLPPPTWTAYADKPASPSAADVSNGIRLHRTALPPLSPLHLLYLLSPLAFIQTILIAHFSGELERARGYVSAKTLHPPSVGGSGSMFVRLLTIVNIAEESFGVSNFHVALLLMNGIMAFALNVASFSANRKVGALSMTVASNVKQVLTILCAVILFNLTITPMNAFGIVLTLAGGVVYAWVDLKERQEWMV